MPEKQSELAKKATDAIRAIDKLAKDIKRDTAKVLEALEELKEIGHGQEEKDEH